MNGRKQARVKKAARIMALVLALIMILSSAYYLLMAVGSRLGYEPASAVYAGGIIDLAIPEEDQFHLDMLEELLQYIKLNYKDEIEYSTMIEGMYKGLMESLGDAWSNYYFKGDSTPDSLSVSLDTEFYGVGISISEMEEGFKIMSIVPGSSAEEAGVPGDGYVVTVDGKDVSAMDFTSMIMLIRGEEGTMVTVGIEKNGKVTEYTLERRKVTGTSLTFKMLEDSVGYIDVDSFANTTASEFRAARLALLNQGMNGLIIDLRDNGGGYIDQAWDMADQLMEKGVCGYYLQQGEVYQTLRTSGNSVRKVPIVLLVNENTASASEALTAALKDSGTAAVVGEVTYGKGEAQFLIDVANGDSLKLSFIYFTGPSKEPVNEVGIIPDYLVYSYGGYTESEAAALVSDMVPLNENERYYEGEYGLNVLAAQQRLKALGYDVEPTARMDEKTMNALRLVQRAAGSYSYGNLDNFTIKALNEQLWALLGIGEGFAEDPQMDKAVEVVKALMGAEAQAAN